MRWRIPAAGVSAAVAVLTACSAPVDEASEHRLGVRNAHGLAFDGRVTLLFGGADDRQVRADTWGWDGRTWQRLAAHGPAPRTFPVMVSGPPGRVYLFGGRRVLFGAALEPSQFLDDLWRWDGRQWERVRGTGPSPRAEAAGAWDPERRRLVVFGGYTAGAGGVTRLGDTWEYGDDGWHHHEVDAPPATHGSIAAYDSEAREVVLFGGHGGRNETWTWNGARWRRVDGVAPPGRYNAAATTGGADTSIVRFGGWDGAARTADTWVWSGLSWRSLDRPGPAARNHAAMAYDSVRGRVVLVGGHEGERVFGDVWELDADRWRQMVDVPAVRRVDNGH